MVVACVFLSAYICDLLVGDPRTIPHPVTAIAGVATAFENIFRKIFPHKLYIAGTLTVILTLMTTVGVLWLVLFLSFRVSFAAGSLVAIILLYFTIATKSLLQHSKAVYQALVPEENIALARERVAMIVGRETSSLDKEKVVKAAVESVAENLVDGITAPLIWAVFLSFFAAGQQAAISLAVIGAMGYKAVNTMDSMFGYKNEKYSSFGWAAARLDDAANFFPARISGLLILFTGILSGGNVRQGGHVFFRDRLNHLSPNAGHSEAAVAGLLNLQFGGPAKYHGVLVDKPYIGDGGRAFEPEVILETNRLILLTSIVMQLPILMVQIAIWN